MGSFAQWAPSLLLHTVHHFSAPRFPKYFLKNSGILACAREVEPVQVQPENAGNI